MNLSIYCPHCHKYTHLSKAPVTHIDRYGSYAPCGESAQWRSPDTGLWWIGICNSCGWPSLVLDNGTLVYPDPLPEPTDLNIPETIRNDLDEAKRAHAAKCFRASATMSRRVIELACDELGAKKGSLFEKIAQLLADGKITEDIKDWATTIRWVGNDAAHPSQVAVGNDDSKDCLDLASQFLHVVFVAPAVSKKRRDLRGKPSTS